MTWRSVVAGTVAVLVLLAGLVTWGVNRTDRALEERASAEHSHPSMIESIERVESKLDESTQRIENKVDKILFLLLEVKK